MTDMTAGGPGLRERKKAKTRSAIRTEAFRLFREQGYGATTIEQIAAAAEVSPATFFRYFPTKEDVVLQDDFDIVTRWALESQPPELSPIAAIRAAAAEALGMLSPQEIEQFRETAQLTQAIPEIRARAMDEFARAINQMAETIAERTGREPEDFEVRNLAGAIVGVIMSTTVNAAEPTWNTETMLDVADLFARIDRALAHLERGLPV